jgi:hypothetical protein
MTDEDFIMMADGRLESVNKPSKTERQRDEQGNGNDGDRYRYPGNDNNNNNNNDNKPKSDSVVPKDTAPKAKPASDKQTSNQRMPKASGSDVVAAARAKGNGSYSHPKDLIFDLMP